MRPWHRVAAVLEVASGIFLGNRPKRVVGRFKECFKGPGFRLSQACSSPLRRIVLSGCSLASSSARAIAWQPLLSMSSLTQAPLCTERLSMMTTCPALFNLRSQDVFHVEPERFRVRRALNAQRWSHTLQHGDRGDKRYVLTPVSRSPPIRSFSPGRPPVVRSEGDVRRGLVHEHQPLWV